MKEIHYFGIVCALVVLGGGTLFYAVVLQPMIGW
jgi:hypothetical protein